MDYKILVKDSDGTYLGEFGVFKELRFGKKLNNYSQCSFDVPVKDPKSTSLYAPRRYLVDIVQCELFTVQTIIWSGEQASRVAELTSNGDDWITITCFSYLEQLNHRFTVAERIFDITDGMDSGDIAWTLIDETQADVNGDLGLTLGVIEPTIIRELKLYNANIMQTLLDLSNMTYGFDFEINDSKVFNVYATKGVDLSSDIQLILGKNVESATIVEDMTNPGNRAIILGQTYDGASMLRIERDDLDSQEAVQLREFMESQGDVSDQDSLEYEGDTILRKYKQPIQSLNIKLVKNSGLKISDFSVGDTVRAIIQKGIFNYDVQMRIHQWDFTLNADKTEELSLLLSIL